MRAALPFLLLVLVLVAPLASARPPAPPAALGIHITDVYTWKESDGDEFFNANITLFFKLSADDPDQVNGDYRYNLTVLETYFGSLTTTQQLCAPDVVGVCTTADLAPGTFYAVADAPGWVKFTQEYSGDPRKDTTLTFNLTTDKLSGADARVSGHSCTVRFVSGVAGVREDCGLINIPWAVFDPQTPTFPLLDVPAMAEPLGVPADVLGLLLGGGAVFMAAITGFLVGGPVVAAVGAAGGFALAYQLSLFPMWLVIVMFLVFVAVVGLSFNRGAGS